jgi:Rrf2 family transcriptional regulator, nitric oxide-sensitive transcriptional repressor
MRLSKYSDYALRVLMYAALRKPELATIDEVADAFDISRHHLVKVVHALGRNGFLSTRRGIGGGFTLALPPAEIGLGNVVRLTESDESVIDCMDSPGQPCRIFPACRLKTVLGEAGAAFFEVLDRYSLEDLVKRKAEMKSLLEV